MNKIPGGQPESFVYAFPGAGKSFHLEKDFFAFGRKYGTPNLSLKLMEESKYSYTDEDVLIGYKNRMKLPIVKRWERVISDKLFFSLREKMIKNEADTKSTFFYKRTISSVYIENYFLDIKRKIALKEKSEIYDF